MLSSAAAIIENGKRGIFRQIQRVPGFFGFGGLKSASGGGKSKRHGKLAGESRLPNLAREFRGSLTLEPLEERIVPAAAVVLVDPNEFVLINYSTMGEYDPANTDGSVYGIIANAGTSQIVVNVDANLTNGGNVAEEDVLDGISLWTNGVGGTGDGLQNTHDSRLTAAAAPIPSTSP